MKRIFVIAGLAICITGCSTSDVAAVAEKPINRQVATQMADFVTPSISGLPNGRKRLSIGEDSSRALAVFPRPSRGFPLEEAIPGLPEGFKSVGWESNTDGFGAVIYDEKIMLAMRQYEALDTEQFAQTLQLVQGSNPSLQWTFLTKNSVDYWLATEGNTTFVISRIAGKKKTYQVTITLGETHLMSALSLVPTPGETANA